MFAPCKVLLNASISWRVDGLGSLGMHNQKEVHLGCICQFSIKSNMSNDLNIKSYVTWIT